MKAGQILAGTGSERSVTGLETWSLSESEKARAARAEQATIVAARLRDMGATDIAVILGLLTA